MTHPTIRTSWFLRKPLWVVARQEHQLVHDSDEDDETSSSSSSPQQHRATVVPRHLSLFDLVSVGVGGTVGSGIFVLLGYIAHHYAGPASAISFLISGLAACCSGVCYAELAGRIPAAGSTYAYAYVAMGELPAVLAAACLTLEYMVSGAAVARSWGDKVVLWLADEWNLPQAERYLDPGYGINPMAFLVSAVAALLLMDGIKESKFVTNVFTVLKVALVIFMTVGGFLLWNADNFKPFLPFGMSGVLRGATSSFFAYLGYDEVCCIAGEALHPQRDMPRAVLLTLAIVTLLYVLAAISLAGMQPHEHTSDTSAFPEAFRYNNVEWAAQLAGAGEVLTLPVVVLITLMAQPRLQLALAQDGLLPSIFGRVDATGNLRSGALISGVTMTIIATFVPFEYLDDLISSGILVAFSMTNGCLILMRRESPSWHPELLGQLLITFNVFCFLTSMLLSRADSFNGTVLAALSGILTLAVAAYLAFACPRKSSFGGTVMHSTPQDGASLHLFQTPFVPFLPCLGTFVNWYLIAQLENLGLVLLMVYLGVAAGLYIVFGFKHSVGNSQGWRRGDYQGVAHADPDSVPADRSGIMLRSLSLPRVDPTEEKSETINQSHRSASF